LAYGFLRGFLTVITQDICAYAVIGDILRGVPAVYVLYAGYDDLGHFAGMETPECFDKLAETDRYFARVERAVQYAPRPYHVIVLSDHGQSKGPTFSSAHGTSLDELVSKLLSGVDVYAALETKEAWDNVNAVLNESVNGDTRTAGVVRTALRRKTRAGAVAVGPDRDAHETPAEEAEVAKAEVIVYGSGCTGLVYFKNATRRQSYEEIGAAHPRLIAGLVEHPGIHFLIVKSAVYGTMVIGKRGVNFVDAGRVEGDDPLAPFGPRAAQHVRKESSYQNAPDLLVNTTYDPVTQELAGFENQASHHGGLGGPQNRPFLIFPKVLGYDGAPIVGAPAVHHLMLGWREAVQGPLAARPQELAAS
jgi:hypothetical protein